MEREGRIGNRGGHVRSFKGLADFSLLSIESVLTKATR